MWGKFGDVTGNNVMFREVSFMDLGITCIYC
jgi:hypothetical protein